MENRQYSTLQYKEIINDFCNEYPNYRKNLYREEIWSEDIYGMADELFHFVNDIMCTKKTSLRTMQNQRIILKRFLDWSVEHGFIQGHLLNSDNYSYNDFAEKFITEMEIEIFYDETIDELIEKIQFNKELCEIIIRCAYEGVQEARQLAKMTYKDIDKFSDKMKAAISKYKAINVHQGSSTNGYRKSYEIGVRQFENHIIKTRDSSFSDITEEKYIKRITSNINEWMESNISVAWNGKYQITYDMIYYSGFINWVKKKCDLEGKPNDYFIKLFRVGNNERAFKRIGDFAKEYNLKVTGNEKIRQACYPYIINSKYFNL